MISLLCALSLLGCSDAALGAAPARDRAGLIHFARAADSSFDRFTQAPTPAQQAWMRTKYWRMRAYAPYFDSRTAWYGGAWAYKDAMAIYPGETKPARLATCATPQGRKLYIWYGCGGGTCPQFAGDIGSPGVPRARGSPTPRAHLAKGYKGLFVDDVNMELRISDGNGNLQWPVDPRTGDADDRARPGAATWPSSWSRSGARSPAPRSSTTRCGSTATPTRTSSASIDAADLIEIERGINDSGLRGGEGVVSLRHAVQAHRPPARQGQGRRAGRFGARRTPSACTAWPATS